MILNFDPNRSLLNFNYHYSCLRSYLISEQQDHGNDCASIVLMLDDCCSENLVTQDKECAAWSPGPAVVISRNSCLQIIGTANQDRSLSTPQPNDQMAPLASVSRRFLEWKLASGTLPLPPFLMHIARHHIEAFASGF